MKKLIIAGAAAAVMAFAGTAVADTVRVDDPTPTGTFSDANNKGYVEVDTAGAIRACNENLDQPAGDDLTGYIWVNPNGEPTEPTYGNANIGAGDADGEDNGDPTDGDESNDCP